MKILITGGTGLIGKVLTHTLTQKGHQVTIVSRSPQLGLSGARLITWDSVSLAKELEKSDAVINLAGASIAGSNPLAMRWTKNRKSIIRSSRIQAGEQLLHAIQRSSRKPEILIQASAIGYYGIKESQTANENSSPGNDFLSSVCLDWERSTAGVEELGVRRIIARLGLVLSRDGGLLPLLALPFKFFLGGSIGNGMQSMSWIHIDDVVNSFIYFIDNPSTQGIFNLTAPSPVQNKAFSKALGKALNRPSWLSIPGWAIKLLLGEASTLAVDGREVIPQRLLDSGYKFNFRQIDHTLKNLFQQ